jgi:hypothetical protein
MYNFSNFIHSVRFSVRNHNISKISTAHNFVQHCQVQLANTLSKAKADAAARLGAN